MLKAVLKNVRIYLHNFEFALDFVIVAVEFKFVSELLHFGHLQ